MGGVTRIGFLGGTFDPPHLGHLVLGAAARAALQLDMVLFVVAGDPWRKGDRRITPAGQRLLLVRAAIEGLAWAEVSEIEISRPGPTYTAESLRELRMAFPGAGWWFLLGADTLRDLPHWHEPESILRQARLGVAQRGEDTNLPAGLPAELIEQFPDLEARVDRVPMPPLDISATALRARIAAGEGTAVWLPLAVRRVIEQQGLYR